MADDEFESRVGTWLRDKWKLERIIGVGGMAGVFEGKHKIGRAAAIKVLRSEIAADKKIRERFEQEAAAVNEVAHHGVVQILDVDEDEDGTPFLVMELLEGETLADRVERDNKMKPEQLLEIVDQLLDVLIACHKKGIIHRDIKPENLFLQSNGRLKVLDFGIARVREGVRTRAGTMLGTVAFMPPEQLKGVDVDARADLFAVGATMFSVIAGRRIHVTENDTQLAMRMLTTPAPRLASVVPDVSKPLALVIDRALAYLAKRRYPDAQTMRGDVWAAQRGERPPYANACEAAGQAPDVVSEEDDLAQSQPPSKTRVDGQGPKSGESAPSSAVPVSGAKPGGDLPSTDPQMPVFADAKSGGNVAGTQPQMPVFVDSSAKPTGAGAAASNTAGEWPPGGDGGSRDDAPASEAPVSEAAAEATASVSSSSSKRSIAPTSEMPQSEEVPASESVVAPTDDEAVSKAPPEEAEDQEPSAADDDTTNDAGDDAAQAGDSDYPPSIFPPSIPPQGPPPEEDPRSVAVAQTSNTGPIVVVLILLGIVAYGAWYAGLFDGATKPQNSDPAAPDASATGASATGASPSASATGASASSASAPSASATSQAAPAPSTAASPTSKPAED